MDVAIDGADEVDMQLNCIKGGGSDALATFIDCTSDWTVLQFQWLPHSRKAGCSQCQNVYSDCRQQVLPVESVGIHCLNIAPCSCIRKDSKSLGEKVRMRIIFQYLRMHFSVFQWTKGIPVEVIPFAYVSVMRKIEALGLRPTLRMAIQKAVWLKDESCFDCLDGDIICHVQGPVVTDNGNFVVDATFSKVECPVFVGDVDAAVLHTYR